MGLLLHLTWGDSWRRPKEGLGLVVDRIQAVSGQLPKPTGPDDPSVDIYIYVSGSVWQHGGEGFRLGTLSDAGRSWLRIQVFVPDNLCGEEESIAYFQRVLDEVAVAVEARLRKRRPGWPVEALVTQIRALNPAA